MAKARKRTRILGSGLLGALCALPLYGSGCSGSPREFGDDPGANAGTGASTADGGDEAQGGTAQGATSSGGSAGSGASAGSAGSAGVGAGPSEGGSGGEGSGENDWSCVEGDLEGSASGTTAGAEDDFAASCGTGTSPDVAYRFVAPAAGYYSFDTLASGFDTVLSLLTGCAGRELGCNQDKAGLPQSEVVASLAKDEEVLVVVDGSVGDQGQYALNVAPVTCPGLDLTGQPFPANLSTVGQQDNFKPTCGSTLPAAAGSLERTLRWVPETDGLYRFSVTTTAFSPTLSLFEGAKCGGQLLQCSYNVTSGHPPEVTRRLKAGEPVTLIVDATDGKSGTFTLDMEKLPDACPVLPKLTQSKTGVSLDEGNGTNLLSSSCVWAGNQYGGTDQPYEEHIYPITIAATGFINCTYMVENIEGTYVAYLLRGNDCGGEELECFHTGTEASFSFSTDDAGDYLLVVENSGPFPGLTLGYDISVGCY